MLRDSLFKLDKYRETLSSKKRQRSELSLNERSNGAKMGSQIHRNPHDIMAQRLEERSKNVGMNKRVRTSVADVRVCTLTINDDILCIFIILLLISCKR